jgi:hypothetical protein
MTQMPKFSGRGICLSALWINTHQPYPSSEPCLSGKRLDVLNHPNQQSKAKKLKKGHEKVGQGVFSNNSTTLPYLSPKWRMMDNRFLPKLFDALCFDLCFSCSP